MKRLEWQGQIRRGYFINGLSGIQFALPDAVEMLENISSENYKSDYINMICMTDPAFPFGAHLNWNLIDIKGNELATTRMDSNHLIFANELPVVYLENFASRMWILNKFKNDYMDSIINQIKS